MANFVDHSKSKFFDHKQSLHVFEYTSLRSWFFMAKRGIRENINTCENVKKVGNREKYTTCVVDLVRRCVRKFTRLITQSWRHNARSVAAK